MENTMNVEMLVAAIANTDNAYTPEEVEDACTDLYNHLKSRVLSRVAFDYCRGQRELAEDAFQSAMLKLFMTIRGNKLQNTHGIYKWVRTACRFYVLDWFRVGEKKEEQYPHWNRSEEEACTPVETQVSFKVVSFSEIDREEEEGSYLSFIESVADEGHYYYDPLRAFNARENRNEANRIIKAAVLNEDQRKVFRMFVMDGMKQEEISRALGMNLNTVKSNLLYARKAIKRWQEKTGYDPYDCIAGTDVSAG